MYDLTRPHRRLTTLDEVQRYVILQDGIIYAYGSGKPLGKIDTMQHLFLDPKHKDYKFCIFCAGTFPKPEVFESHLMVKHQDVLMLNASKKAPKDAKPGMWIPSPKMLQDEAKKLAGTEEAAPEPESSSNGDEPKEEEKPKKGKSWREPVKK